MTPGIRALCPVKCQVIMHLHGYLSAFPHTRTSVSRPASIFFNNPALTTSQHPLPCYSCLPICPPTPCLPMLAGVVTFLMSCSPFVPPFCALPAWGGCD